ncbi:TPA: 50S ribosomal protein L3 [Candidatus Falkowbacteria bacterium]|nr:50S ribosomal protein L3 [Candidatus Falkowbacteria bacterium]
MKFILGQKIEMTQVFSPEGAVIPVTKIKAGPALVIQKKTIKIDGYNSLVIAFGEVKKVTKPLLSIFKKVSPTLYRHIREIRLPEGDNTFDKVSIGDVIYAENFNSSDIVSVVGMSKGKGFQGVVKRHGFSGGPASHGHKDQLRMPGSIAAGGPQHVFKGTRMGGHMGFDRVTVAGLKVVDVDVESGVITVKGAVPGPRNGLIQLVADGDMEIIKKSEAKPTIEAAVSSESVAKIDTQVTEPVSVEVPAVAADESGANNQNAVEAKTENQQQ